MVPSQTQTQTEPAPSQFTVASRAQTRPPHHFPSLNQTELIHKQKWGQTTPIQSFKQVQPCPLASRSAVATTLEMEMLGPPTVCAAVDWSLVAMVPALAEKAAANRGRQLEYHHALHTQIEIDKPNTNWTGPIQTDLSIKLNQTTSIYTLDYFPPNLADPMRNQSIKSSLTPTRQLDLCGRHSFR